jgi:hypothetical protein
MHLSRTGTRSDDAPFILQTFRKRLGNLRSGLNGKELSKREGNLPGEVHGPGERSPKEVSDQGNAETRNYGEFTDGFDTVHTTGDL